MSSEELNANVEAKYQEAQAKNIKFECAVENCKRVIKGKQSFKEHQKVHTGERPFDWQVNF